MKILILFLGILFSVSCSTAIVDHQSNQIFVNLEIENIPIIELQKDSNHASFFYFERQFPIMISLSNNDTSDTESYNKVPVDVLIRYNFKIGKTFIENDISPVYDSFSTESSKNEFKFRVQYDIHFLNISPKTQHIRIHLYDNDDHANYYLFIGTMIFDIGYCNNNHLLGKLTIPFCQRVKIQKNILNQHEFRTQPVIHLSYHKLLSVRRYAILSGLPKRVEGVSALIADLICAMGKWS